MTVKQIALGQIFSLIKQETGVTRQQIEGRKKTRLVSRARRLYCYILREQGISYSQIGRLINKNHATVILCVRAVESSNDKELALRLVEQTRGEDMQVFTGKDDSSPQQGAHRLYKNIRKNSVARSQKWQWLFNKFEARCQICTIEDVLEVHHIIPLKNGGSNHESNLLILCPNHHAMLHAGLLYIENVPKKKEVV